MHVNRFEDLIVWQKSKDLVLLMYRIFRENRDFAFRDQMLRAVLSIMNNIAEGFERRSSRELVAFLYISKGSCGEVRSMLYIASELGYISNQQLDDLLDRTHQISKMLYGLICKL
ncbi:MAG: four helix bundle protein [Patescibacteria group bacterium]|nr:four helix bundle protein [Patescibacteria group bacterium]